MCQTVIVLLNIALTLTQNPKLQLRAKCSLTFNPNNSASLFSKLLSFQSLATDKEIVQVVMTFQLRGITVDVRSAHFIIYLTNNYTTLEKKTSTTQLPTRSQNCVPFPIDYTPTSSLPDLITDVQPTSLS